MRMAGAAGTRVLGGGHCGSAMQGCGVDWLICKIGQHRLVITLASDPAPTRVNYILFTLLHTTLIPCPLVWLTRQQCALARPPMTTFQSVLLPPRPSRPRHRRSSMPDLVPQTTRAHRAQGRCHYPNLPQTRQANPALSPGPLLIPLSPSLSST